MLKMQKVLLSALLLAGVSANAGEILTNRDFSKTIKGVPAGWTFQQHRTKPEFKLFPAKDGNPAYVKITTNALNAQGFINYRLVKDFPAGCTITISGEYRTENVSFGKNGLILTNLIGRVDLKSNTQPRYWQNLFLKPSDTWSRFEKTDRLKYPVKSLQYNAGLSQAKGTVYYRNLSVKVELPSFERDPKADFVWREAEDIDKIRPPSTLGFKYDPEYYSGRGAISTEKGNIDWTFQIKPVTDPVTLFSKERTWYLWARIYGYLESPRIRIFRNNTFMTHVDTPANELTDAKGNYAGDGKYLWVLCGKFTTTGGMQQISFRPSGRMGLDAWILTDDAKFAPVKFEVKKFKQADIQDISTSHMIKAENTCEGITDVMPLPLAFRIGGKSKKISADQKPAIFHFTLPEDITVKGVSSHWAGKDWNRPDRWGKKFLSWKKTATRTVKGKKFCDYEVELYYLCDNQYMVFLQADSKAIKSRANTICEYYLENNGEKQLKESISLKHFAFKTTKPFEKIYIGPDSAPFQMMYYSYPELFQTLKKSGLNHMGFWGSTWEWGEFFDKFRDECYKNNVRLTATIVQYTGIKPQHRAIGIDGKPIPTRLLTLAMDEKDAPIGETLERIRRTASRGINVVFDDEMTNVVWDKMDYSPKVKKLFREWLAKEHKGVAYCEPEQIVKNRAKDPVMYNLWVDFKCARIAYWYSLYRKAFDEGLAKAAGKYPANCKPQMITCVQGLLYGRDGKPCNAELIKESNYLDYRLLSKYCDIIEMMTYTYGGVKQSAMPGDKMALYNAYTGKNNTAPILLVGGYGTEVMPEQKVMLKYQVWEALMQKTKILVFYSGATLFNAYNLFPVVEAIRIARPYEDFFVDGKHYSKMTAGSSRVRMTALELGKKVLLYANNYDNTIGATEKITFPTAPKSVLDCANNKKLKVSDRGFTFDFKSDRGKLFLVEF